MKCSPSLLVAAFVGVVAPGLPPMSSASVQPPLALPTYHVRVDWQKAETGAGGLVVRGRVTNTGTLPLTYTQVVPTLMDHAGREIFRGSGYLTVSPLMPGQSAEFRACEASAPRFASLRMVFREAGHPVLVDRVNTAVKPKAPAVFAKTARVF